MKPARTAAGAATTMINLRANHGSIDPRGWHRPARATHLLRALQMIYTADCRPRPPRSDATPAP